jgi:hypothetical protein
MRGFAQFLFGFIIFAVAAAPMGIDLPGQCPQH